MLYQNIFNPNKVPSLIFAIIWFCIVVLSRYGFMQAKTSIQLFQLKEGSMYPKWISEGSK